MTRPQKYEFRSLEFDENAPFERRAIGFARVSTVRQGEGTSIGDQIARIQEYSGRNDLVLVGIVVLFESGKDSNRRPAFNQGLAAIEEHHAKHIVFFHSDRIGRNLTDHERLHEAVQAGKFSIHLAAENRVLHKDSPDGDFLSADLLSIHAKQLSRDNRRRAIASAVRKAELGIYPTRAPFGYRNQKAVRDDGHILDRGGTIVLTEWGREFLPVAFNDRLAGLSLARIAENMVANPLVPQNLKHTFRGPGRAQRVKNMLTNSFYFGQFSWRGKLYEGIHDTVISRETWEAVQATFNGAPAPVRAKAKGAYAGMLECAECGCRITYDPKKRGEREYHYYRCANGKSAHETRTSVTEQAVTEGLAPAIDQISIEPALAQMVADALNVGHERIRGERRKEAARHREALGLLEGREDSLIDLRTRGALDDSLFARQLAKVREERSRLTSLLEQSHEDLDDAYLFTAKRVFELATQARTLWNAASAEEKAALLKQVLSNAQLRGRSVEYSLQKPFRILSEIGEDPDWRTPKDSNL